MLTASQTWPSMLTTSALSDTGIPGVGSYGTLGDPIPSATVPAVTSPQTTGTPASLTGVIQQIISPSSSASFGFLPTAGVILLSVLLIVVGAWIILEG